MDSAEDKAARRPTDVTEAEGHHVIVLCLIREMLNVN